MKNTAYGGNLSRQSYHHSGIWKVLTFEIHILCFSISLIETLNYNGSNNMINKRCHNRICNFITNKYEDWQFCWIHASDLCLDYFLQLLLKIIFEIVPCNPYLFKKYAIYISGPQCLRN